MSHRLRPLRLALLCGAAGALAGSAFAQQPATQPAPQPAKALLSITPSNTLTASTVDANGFTLTNQSQGGQQITRVVVDLSEAVLQDPVVFDPSNTASGKPFTVNSQTGTFTVTPTFASGSANNGYTQLVLNFTGFDPGESLGFSLDADPLSLLMQATGVTASTSSPAIVSCATSSSVGTAGLVQVRSHCSLIFMSFRPPDGARFQRNWPRKRRSLSKNRRRSLTP